MQENPWTVRQEHHAHMKLRQNQLRKKGMSSAEKWFFDEIATQTNLKWTYQATWGFRLFDFWNATLGVAVEIDGAEHDQKTDKNKDLKEWERSKIIIFRIRNFNKEDADYFLDRVRQIDHWKQRRLRSA